MLCLKKISLLIIFLLITILNTSIARSDDITITASEQGYATSYNGGNSTLTVSGVSYPAGFSGNLSGTISDGSSWNVPVIFAPTAATNYGGQITVNSDSTSGDNTIPCSGVGESGGGDSYEPDNTFNDASTISSNSSQTHSIDPATDVDFVKFTLGSTSDIVLETSGPSGGDTRLWLYDSNQNQITFDDDGSTSGYFSRISQINLAAGTYYAKIDEFYNDNIINSYDISLTVNPIIPTTISLAPIYNLLLNSPSTSTYNCGAYIAPGVWKQFDCYNLAAIGKTTGDDPFTPSWRLIGGYWQWGRKGPSSSQWHNTNTTQFAHGPIGPGYSEANDSVISGWDQTDAPNGSWSDASKTDNDPCPVGFRVPTRTQWDGVDGNNTKSTVGSWSNGATNYSGAMFFGNNLMLHATGGRNSYDGSLGGRGYVGIYWSSTEHQIDSAWWHGFNNDIPSLADAGYRRYGTSVRCVAESEGPACTYSISSSSGSFTSGSGSKLVAVTASNSSCSWTTTNNFSSWVTLSPTSGTGSNNVIVSVTANPGAARSGSVTIAGNTYAISQDGGSQPGNCGAYVASGVWKEFDCYNLAAIGKTTNDDPFTPSWRLIGGYWRWGRKGPSASLWHTTNTENFIHGPTGSGSSESNEGIISEWYNNNVPAPDGSWSNASKTANDPCPYGYRVPTNHMWEAVLYNNTLSATGSWSVSATNYSSALVIGNALMLPAAGTRGGPYGDLVNRGVHGSYWSSTDFYWDFVYHLEFLPPMELYGMYGSVECGARRTSGYSVRCVKE